MGSSSEDLAGSLNFRSCLVPKRVAEDAGMAMDPPVSEAQRKAMFAAKNGNSTLGIPKSVGAEFANADPGGKLPKTAKDGGPGSGQKGHKGFQAKGDNPKKVLKESETFKAPGGNNAPQTPWGFSAKDCDITGDGNRQRIATELKEVAERIEASRSIPEIISLQARRDKLHEELMEAGMTNDAMNAEELDKWEKEKENAGNMAPKNAENIAKNHDIGHSSESTGRNVEFNKAKA